MSLRRICVFAGARPGVRAEYLAGAKALGRELVARGIGLVYGGASVGLMGEIADEVLAGGGEVIGVIPSWLVEREIGHRGLSELRVVESMHARKAMMAELADAFVALPGGFGTFDELFEIVTWAQLRLHQKPIGVLDVAGYFAPVRALVAHAVAEGFASPENSGLLVARAAPGELVDALAALRASPAGVSGTARADGSRELLRRT
jgi:uncharacterized protein (TIGR00730 family)